MSTGDARALSPLEYDAVRRLVAKLPSEVRDQVMADVASAMVRPDAGDGSRLVFEIPGYERPPYEGQRPYPFEGKLRDDDGADVCVVLHADQNGRLFELELIRWAEGELIRPDWTTFTSAEDE